MIFFNKIVNLRFISFFLSLVGFFIIFQNNSASERISYKDSILSFDAENFNTKKECEESDFEFCLFSKNPFYSKKMQKNPSDSKKSTWLRGDLQLFQTKGVNLIGLDDSGYLKNERLLVKPHKGEKVNLNNFNNLKFNYPSSKLSQIAAYYWAYKTLTLIEAYRKDRESVTDQLTIFTDYTITGWSSKNRAIYLNSHSGIDDNSLDAALNAETIIHLVSVADLYFQTKGSIYEINDKSKYTVCGSTNEEKSSFYEDTCCSSKRACSKALSFGQADYIVGLFFPESPIIGESYVEDIKGLSYCGILRNLDEVKDLKAEDFFRACVKKGKLGQVYTMGIFYASLWWELRRKASEKQRENDIDKLFFLHRFELNGDDDIVTAFEKVKILDKELFSSEESLSSLISEVLIERGVLSENQ